MLYFFTGIVCVSFEHEIDFEMRTVVVSAIRLCLRACACVCVCVHECRVGQWVEEGSG